MDKYIKKGMKKLFALTKTKIKLAEQHKTSKLKPAPLPLIKIISAKELFTLEDAKSFLEELKAELDFNSSVEVARTTLELLEVIEGVKWKFEPSRCFSQISEDDFKKLEERCLKENLELHFLFMTKSVPENAIGIYIGENPPSNAIFLSEVPSSISTILPYLFSSSYFSYFPKLKLRNVASVLGKRTLLNSLIHFSLGQFGSKLEYENQER